MVRGEKRSVKVASFSVRLTGIFIAFSKGQKAVDFITQKALHRPEVTRSARRFLHSLQGNASVQKAARTMKTKKESLTRGLWRPNAGHTARKATAQANPEQDLPTRDA
jgi:hypothetical protein